jgi:hypothetical protein
MLLNFLGLLNNAIFYRLMQGLAVHNVGFGLAGRDLELLHDFCEDLQDSFGGAFQCERLALRVIEQR